MAGYMNNTGGPVYCKATIRNDDVRRRIETELLSARNHLEAADRILRDAIHFPEEAQP